MLATTEKFIHDAVAQALAAFGLSATPTLSVALGAGGRKLVRVKLVPGAGPGLPPRRWGLVAVGLQSLVEAGLLARGEGAVAIEVAPPESQGGYPSGELEPDDALARSVRAVARRAAALGRPFAIGPMSAVERRLVHQALSDLPEVHTQSEGEGIYRRLWVVPRRPAPATGEADAKG